MLANLRRPSAPLTRVRRASILAVVILTSGLVASGPSAGPGGDTPQTIDDSSHRSLDWEDDLADIDLEGLMHIPVTSVAGGFAKPISA